MDNLNNSDTISKSHHTTKKNRLEKKLYVLTHRPFFMFVLFSSTSMTVLGATVVAASIPSIEKHFIDIPHIDMLSKLILTLPALFVMLFSPLSGILLDKFGRLKFLIPAMFIWSIAGSLGALWDNIYWILCTRALFGIATAFVMTAASALVADYYVGEERQSALGLQGFATACGSACFMCIGGLLAMYDWHYPFYVYTGGIFLAILATLMLFEPRSLRKKESQVHTQEKFNIFPFLPLYFFAFMTMAAYYTSPTQIPHFLTHNLGRSEFSVGFSISASALAYGSASLLYPKIRKYLNISMIYTCGFACMGSGFLLIFFFHNLYSVSLGLLFVGIGGGPIIVNNSSYLLTKTPKAHIAKAMGILTAMTYLGQFVSPLLSQPIVRHFGIVNLFCIIACMLFILSFLAFLQSRFVRH